ncbi:MAG: DUF4301 family protein [Candidatus Eisenbacteria bacterium]|uniref:DUF4301 family protein n=1 Tax=Eiseniibacteriota bacterium TaxID=2212470 RepID=A0A933SF61_UNCEI|nr:DUF4301 family protein [Candidatus Eisenbacteria bacterium]
MSGTPQWFSPEDEAVLARRGVSLDEAVRQLRTLAHPPGFALLDRPCTPGDGIVALDEGRLADCVAAHAEAAAEGRVTVFVPASGAATRMFKDLLALLGRPGDLAPADVRAAAESGDAEARALLAWVEGLPRFAFRDALARVLASRGLELEALRTQGPWRALLEGALNAGGLAQAQAPKALLEFHREGVVARTAFEEQLAEGAMLARDRDGRTRMHFTVSPEHRAQFEALLARARAERELPGTLEYATGFSEQHPATDTLAGDPAGGPFRDPSGALLFRPSGHGALLRNLDALHADLVFLKNIDNVAAGRLRGETSRWAAALLGLASQLAALAHALLARLDAGDASAPAEAAAFLRESLGEPAPPADAAALREALARPVRVCGMVRNTGEPGGGPFWVRDREGRLTRQIVESAQVDPASAEQVAILRAATHFNPVFLACALRGADGRPYALDRFTDPDAVIVTRKSAFGRDLLALERPGLWNGAMARWNTVFVEVPLAVFNPVKTVLDLLRPEHQA